MDFDKDSGLDAEEWCGRLERRREQRGYKLGRIWLPHDARAKTFAAKHSAVEIFIGSFGVERIGIVPDATKADRINAARRILPRCSFHATKTEKGRDGLSAWAYVYDEERKEFSKEPDHNWASHDGDAFSYGAQVLEEQIVPKVEDSRQRILAVGDIPDGFAGASIEDMWREHDREMRSRGRI